MNLALKILAKLPIISELVFATEAWKENSHSWSARFFGIPTVVIIRLAMWFFVALVITGFIQHHAFHMWY